MDSPFELVKSLEMQIKGLLGRVDVQLLESGERKRLRELRAGLTDARLDIRDYELSETRAEQLQNAKQAAKRLEHIRKHILALSETNVFGAADVAQLTAQIEQVSDNLR